MTFADLEPYADILLAVAIGLGLAWAAVKGLS